MQDGISKGQNILLGNALNSTIKPIYFFENIFASHKWRFTPCPSSPNPTLRTFIHFLCHGYEITSFLADLIASLCVHSKIKSKLKRKCLLPIYLFLSRNFLSKCLLTAYYELLITWK